MRHCELADMARCLEWVRAYREQHEDPCGILSYELLVGTGRGSEISIGRAHTMSRANLPFLDGDYASPLHEYVEYDCCVVHNGSRRWLASRAYERIQAEGVEVSCVDRRNILEFIYGTAEMACRKA